MPFAAIPEYEGKSPYVFITYAQQDEKIAYSIAVKMYNEGFRLWSSAACGNPSNMRIAERLSNSAVAMVFLSRSYLKYASYKEFEPRAVMNSPKQKIVICLDDTPIGTDWNTVDFPAGIRYNPDIPQELWLRINSSDTLEKCRGAWPKKPLPLPFDEVRTVNVSVDEDELSDEFSDLNAVMSSFGAGLDENDIRSISLFNRATRRPPDNWPPQSESTQEQEYYAIENLIDNAPLPDQTEQKQYDNMLGLIERFAEKSNRRRDEELRRRLDESKEKEAETPPAPAAQPVYQSSYGNYRPVPKNEFDRIDLTQDISSNPVVITESSDVNTGIKPIEIDYGDDSEVPAYDMTRRRGAFLPEAKTDEPPAPITTPEEPPAPPLEKKPEPPSRPSFERIVDDRKIITSTEDNADSARLTYHLGALDAFLSSEKDDETPLPIETAKSPTQPPSRVFEGEIPQPALRFDKPVVSETGVSETSAPETPKEKRRLIVAVRQRVRRMEYESEMYEVNGRWIPGEIYHRLMPDAKYTMVRRVSRPEPPAPVKSPLRAVMPPRRAPRTELSGDSRLYGAVNTFFTPPRQTPSRPAPPAAESIPEPLRQALRERHETRRAEAIRQLEEETAQPVYTGVKKSAAPAGDEENTPARKHKFSHEGGIKKSLMAGMETPVNTDTEESHRQFGARAELMAEESASGIASVEKEASEKRSKKKEEEKAVKKAAQKAAEKAARKEAQKKAVQKKAEEEKKSKKKKSSKPSKEETPSPAPRGREALRLARQRSLSDASDVDEDSLIELPRRNLPDVDYDPEAYRDMNLSEILFGQSGEKNDDKKKKKK